MVDSVAQHQPAVYTDYSVVPEVFPQAWASAWGEDKQGLWMAFEYKGVEQRFRWIHPGRFLMGSPETEKNRDSDELLHPVTLNRGYWLADTACTQALWQAVMGDNPSEFSGDNKPVDNVSWNDAHRFIEKLNHVLPALELRLPSEAQWEYACRAGSETPFSFGETIMTDQVNYDGNHPYGDAEDGEYRQETVVVKSLPCSDWGLYEMHGNVWEWCQDWYDGYDTNQVVNPIGPESGESRVLRGGSWINFARRCRSAYRLYLGPGDRGDFTGFRLARG